MDESPPTQTTDRERAIELAYKALATRERTVCELRCYLERKRVGPRAIEAAIAQLQEAGFLDDVRFARQFAEDKRALELWGSERIAIDLRRRGIEPDIIEQATGASSRADELASALVLLGERVRTPLGTDRERDKAWRLLIRRGYDHELAYEAVRAHERRGAAPRHRAA
jgi:regulatory protein